MDCVRISTKEFDNEYHNAIDYKQIGSLSNKGAGECRQMCVSDLDCKVWKYTDNNCYISERSLGSISYKKGAISGVISCEKTYSVLHLFLLIFLLGLILVGVLWFMNTKTNIHLPKITFKGKNK